MQQLVQEENFELLGFKPFEQLKRDLGFFKIAGIDEVGRGPLAGPVIAVTCLLLPGFFSLEKEWIKKVQDSKKLTVETRQKIFEAATQDRTVVFGVGSVDSTQIDQINILQATFLAMERSFEQMKRMGNPDCSPDYLLVDGNKTPKIDLPMQTIVGGDAVCFSIALASILAKVIRDREMERFHQQYPLYGFDQHKGYGTKKHLQAIALHGACPIHRLSFEPLKSRELKSHGSK